MNRRGRVPNLELTAAVVQGNTTATVHEYAGKTTLGAILADALMTLRFATCWAIPTVACATANEIQAPENYECAYKPVSRPPGEI